MVKKPSYKGLNRRDAYIRLLLALVIIVLVNIVAQVYYFRLDLTAEKRYSISNPSKQLARELKDVVTIKVYLEGDLNAGFRRLQESVRNTLNEFRAYGGKNIEYEFIDPMAITDLNERKALMTDLIDRGLKPTNLTTKGKTGSVQQLIFPGATVAYGGREMSVNLLENQMGYSPYEILNNSANLLEYKFANAIQKLAQFRPPRVGFVDGNGELSNLEMADVQETLLALQYEVKRFRLDSSYYIPERFDAIVIAKPLTAFSEQAKYKIDQYIMRGGKVLWLIDYTTASLDSLYGPKGQDVQTRELNLDDMLFKYGVRINNNLIQDINLCGQIPLVTGSIGGTPQTQLFSWYYYPLLISDNNHPVVRNLSPVYSQFPASIDTIQNPGVSKTILLHTTDNAKAPKTPTRVHFGILQTPPKAEYYNELRLSAAVLLEGSFESVFKNRMSPEFLSASDTIENLKFIENGKAGGKMIVVADGDIIRNEVRRDSTYAPLGTDMFTKQQYANKDFILNCIEYLTDNTGILETRNKEVKLRMLNSTKVEEERLQWQLINIALPIVLMLLLGGVFTLLRKRKYAA